MKNFFFRKLPLGVSVFFLLAGCQQQSLNDKLAQNIVQKAIENASGGNVKMDLNNSSDNNRNLNIQTKDGTTIIGSGKTRPDSAPSDLPTINGAKDFSWFGSADGGMFGYTIANSDYKAVCSQQLDLLAKAGWNKGDDYSLDVEKLMMRTLEKTGFGVSISCSIDDHGITIVAMTKSKQ